MQAFKHFVSRGAMDIEGFGEKLVYRFFDEGLVRSLPDIYRLTVERLEPLEGFQRRSAENLVGAIERSKRQPFHRVLYALGIPGIGGVNARALAVAFRLDRPPDGRRAGGDRGGRGHRPDPRGPRSRRRWPSRATGKLIEELRAAGLQHGGGRRGPDGDGRARSKGQTFVLTGTLERHDPRRGDGAHHRGSGAR